MSLDEIALEKATEFLEMEFKNDTQKKAYLQCVLIELLRKNNLDSSQLIRLANYKFNKTKEKNYDRQSYLNGFTDGYASRR